MTLGEMINIHLREFDLKIEGLGELSKLADKFGSDKGFQNGAGHLYTQFYEKLTQSFRFSKFTLVEIGLLSAHHQKNFETLGYEGLYAGEQGHSYYQYPSLSMWSDFFPFAEIIGLDKEKFEIDNRDTRIAYKYFNADNPSTIIDTLYEISPMIIIDDASHIYKHQQDTFFNSFQHLAAGGLYIIEDLNSVQGNFREGYKATEMIFQKGPESLRLSPAYQVDPIKGDKVLSLIESIQFSKSLQSGNINTVCIKKRAAS